jgi:RNA polymerase sigma-70 factor (ECF subfamily)
MTTPSELRRPAVRGSFATRRIRSDTGEVSDESLLAGMANGDEQAAVLFVRRYQRRAYGLARSLTGDGAMAEDIAEEALVRAWRHAQVFDPRRGSVASWVLTITRNLAIDALRVRRAVPVEPTELLLLLGEDRRSEDAFATPGVNAVVRRALRTLAPEQQRALVLAALYGHTAQEVAEQEGIPLGTAKSRIRAGLAKLRVVITEGEDPR